MYPDKQIELLQFVVKELIQKLDMKSELERTIRKEYENVLTTHSLVVGTAIVEGAANLGLDVSDKAAK